MHSKNPVRPFQRLRGDKMFCAFANFLGLLEGEPHNTGKLVSIGL
jgi:hypothetical protein